MTDANQRVPYIAVLLYELHVDDTPPTFREDIALIWASSDEEAERRANEHGKVEEAEYDNVHGQHVVMKLKHVIDINAAFDTDLTQDADLYERHFRDFEAYGRFESALSEDSL